MKQVGIRKIFHSDEVLALKTRRLLKTLWLFFFFFLSIFLSVQLSELAVIVLLLLNSTHGSNVRQKVTTARHDRYSTNGFMNGRVELFFSSLSELFRELGVN